MAIFNSYVSLPEDIFHNYHSVFRQQDLMEATKKSWLCIVFQKTLTAVVPSPSALMFCLSTLYQG